MSYSIIIQPFFCFVKSLCQFVSKLVLGLDIRFVKEYHLLMTNYKFALYDIAKARGLNGNRVALMVGMSRQAITMLMRPDVQQVRVDTVAKICAGLDLKPADLFVPTEPVK